MNESNISGKFDQIAGRVKQGIGEATGDQSLAKQGAADQVKGNAKEAWGNVKDMASTVRDNAQTNTATDGNQHTATNTGRDMRDSITDAAERTKTAVQNTLNGVKDDH